MAEKQGTKLCKHCKTEIPAGAKICPNCKKKQGGALKWVIIGVVAVAIIGSAGGNKEESNSNGNSSVQASAGTTNTDESKESVASVESTPTPEPQAEIEDTQDKYPQFQTVINPLFIGIIIISGQISGQILQFTPCFFSNNSVHCKFVIFLESLYCLKSLFSEHSITFPNAISQIRKRPL